jgi:hypothetical protein
MGNIDDHKKARECGIFLVFLLPHKDSNLDKQSQSLLS